MNLLKSLPAIYALRRSRLKHLFAAYWGITITVGLLLPPGSELGELGVFLHKLVGSLPGVAQVASRSFDALFVETFVSLSLFCANALAAVSCFWIPSGSEKTFPDKKAKMVFVLCGLLMLGLALRLTLNEYSSQGLSGGRTAAFLYLGASTKFGVLTILNVWFGFAQLFFFVALRAGVTTSVFNFGNRNHEI